MIFKKRNISSSVGAITTSTDSALWTDWTIEKAVRDGYESSGWVYKSISLISRNAASVPFVVKNKDNEIQWDHPLTKLLMDPHPYLSRTQFYELLIQWLELAGNCYINTISDSRSIKELWAVSPDRIAPIESKDNRKFIDGYSEKLENGVTKKSVDFTIENIIHISLTNPANPLMGISPLKAVSKGVDTDVAQQDWNASAMQNRGVVEGVFTFKDHLEEEQADNLVKRIMRKFSGSVNARKPLVIGADAKYTRLSLTTAEMDFLESRKFNRDEIFAIFGVPPQLGGSQEASTYNNFSASMRIFWESTLIPLLNLMATQFTSSFSDTLEDGSYISFDLSGVSALLDDEDEKAATAKSYYDMGVPFEQINEKFELGFTQWEGWNMPFNGIKKNDNPESRSLKLIPLEKRNTENEAEKKDTLAEGVVKNAFVEFFKRQELAVLLALSSNEDPIEVVKSFDDELRQLITNITVGVASQFAETVTTDSRGLKLNFEIRGELEDQLIDEFLLEEGYILTELSAIQDSTVKVILDQVRDASAKGFDYDDLRRALDDTGIFAPDRALRIARTEVGTASSIGQVSSATVAGATHKKWQTSGFEVRSAHSARQNEEVKINGGFSKQTSNINPRFPSDPRMSAGDRINCNCFLTFRTE